MSEKVKTVTVVLIQSCSSHHVCLKAECEFLSDYGKYKIGHSYELCFALVGFSEAIINAKRENVRLK